MSDLDDADIVLGPGDISAADFNSAVQRLPDGGTIFLKAGTRVHGGTVYLRAGMQVRGEGPACGEA